MIVVVWTGENDTKTIGVDANRFENRAKQLRFCLKKGLAWTGPYSKLQILKTNRITDLMNVLLCSVNVYRLRISESMPFFSERVQGNEKQHLRTFTTRNMFLSLSAPFLWVKVVVLSNLFVLMFIIGANLVIMITCVNA